MKLHCLSILQPLANDIMNGEKLVENRSWNWLKDRDWKKEGPILLGIHASTNKSLWNEYSEEEKALFSNESQAGKVEFGKVLGIVELIEICRPRKLPKKLADHWSVIKGSDNWCWVLRNPKWFPKPVKATGQAKLFFASIPSKYVKH